MAAQPGPAVVWIPNVELFLLLANLTEEGTRYQSRAVHPLRRAAWLRYDANRRAPAVHETARLLRDGFWLESLTELGLTADNLPKVGFNYPLSREAVVRAGVGSAEDGLSRLDRYLEATAAFTLDVEPLEFFRSHAEDYRSAVSELEISLSNMTWLGSLEQYFGAEHRSYMCVVSLLMPAGFSFGLPVETPEGPMAFHVSGPFIETDGRLTFGSPLQALTSVERELLRAFIRPVVTRGQLAAEPFARTFERERASFQPLGYERALDCLEDHLVYAVQGRLQARRGEREAAEALMQFDEDSGYRYVRHLSGILEDYELHRSDFPTLDEFFPHLMDSFVGDSAGPRT